VGVRKTYYWLPHKEPLSMGPKRVGAYLMSLEDEVRPSFRNVALSTNLEFRKMDKVHKSCDSEKKVSISRKQSLTMVYMIVQLNFYLLNISLHMVLRHVWFQGPAALYQRKYASNKQLHA
jgi:hypothetical protein